MITIDELEKGYRALIRLIGPGFHPDAPGTSYNLPAGITPEVVTRMNNLAAMHFDVDMYKIALEEVRAMQEH